MLLRKVRSEYKTLAGQGAIEEVIHGLTFKVSPASFFQVNPAQAEQLYQKALDFAALTGQERVLDAYCGVGTLSLILARHAKEVVGVECVPQAIEDAKENAALNHIHNASFVCAPAEDFISTLEAVDVAILNPPRKGCEPSFLERLQVLHPKRIVYVSCDPATLARDLQILCSSGYQLQAVQPFDMFPQTAHVETVVKLITN
jgi:23S rRNA (uracil1939-C5)-methyltransferase